MSVGELNSLFYFMLRTGSVLQGAAERVIEGRWRHEAEIAQDARIGRLVSVSSAHLAALQSPAACCGAAPGRGRDSQRQRAAVSRQAATDHEGRCADRLRCACYYKILWLSKEKVFLYFECKIKVTLPSINKVSVCVVNQCHSREVLFCEEKVCL